jgi:hypothetical protein
VSRVAACGCLRVAGDVTPRGVKGHPVGRRDDGDEPVTLAHTGCPCARVQGSAQDFVALLVPGGAGMEAQFDLVGVRAADKGGPVSSLERLDGSSAHQIVGSQTSGARRIPCVRSQP